MNPLSHQVFVSHADGYLGTHIVAYFLQMGVSVIVGVEEREGIQELDHIHELFKIYKSKPDIRLVNFAREESLKAALAGCESVIHPLAEEKWYIPDDPVECYKKSIADSLKLLHCCSDMKIGRVIFTGSLISVYGGSDNSKTELQDTDWGNIYNTTPQARAFLFTEKAVWSFVQTLSHQPKLTVLNLGCMLGPSLNPKEKHASMKFMIKLVNGNLDYLLPIQFPVIDVRDAALIHCLILSSEGSHNKRINVCQGQYRMEELAEILGDEFKFLELNISRSSIGGLPIKLATMLNSKLKNIFFQCGKESKISCKTIKQLVSIDFRALDETLVDMGYQIMDRGLITKNQEKLKPFLKKNTEQTPGGG